MYAKDPYHSKYQFLIKERQEVRQKHFNPKVLIEYSNDITVKWYYHTRKPRPIVTDLFIRDWKLIISLVFIAQSYFPVPKDVRLNATHFFTLKIANI